MCPPPSVVGRGPVRWLLPPAFIARVHDGVRFAHLPSRRWTRRRARLAPRSCLGPAYPDAVTGQPRQHPSRGPRCSRLCACLSKPSHVPHAKVGRTRILPPACLPRRRRPRRPRSQRPLHTPHPRAAASFSGNFSHGVMTTMMMKTMTTTTTPSWNRPTMSCWATRRVHTRPLPVALGRCFF